MDFLIKAFTSDRQPTVIDFLRIALAVTVQSNGVSRVRTEFEFADASDCDDGGENEAKKQEKIPIKLYNSVEKRAEARQLRENE